MERQDFPTSDAENDDERIATVTYLFGIKPDEDEAREVAEPAAPPAVAPAPARAATVRFEKTRFEETSFEEAEEPTPVVGSHTKSPEKKSARTENVSMHALTRRGMSVAEMTRLLENREIDADDVAAEIERLEGAGLLDDAALAENLVRTLQDRKGLGRSAISAELRRRKVDQVAIEEALGSIDTDDELTRAIEVATKRAGQLRSYDAETARRRLGAYLQRRGYGGSILSAAMTAALAPAHDSGGPRFR